MINYMLFNFFITFMPHGKVTQVDSADLTDFDEKAGVPNFLSRENDIVVCNTDDWGWGDSLGPGMARLSWYNPTSRANGDKTEPGSYLSQRNLPR